MRLSTAILRGEIELNPNNLYHMGIPGSDIPEAREHGLDVPFETPVNGQCPRCLISGLFCTLGKLIAHLLADHGIGPVDLAEFVHQRFEVKTMQCTDNVGTPA